MSALAFCRAESGNYSEKIYFLHSGQLAFINHAGL